MKIIAFALLLVAIAACSTKSSKENFGKPIGYIQLENTALEISELVTDLEVPWDIEAGIEGELWFTEVNGAVYRLDLKKNQKTKVFQVPDLIAKKSYGLLGMTVHPSLGYVFLHYTFAIANDKKEETIKSRLVRYEFKEDTLANPLILLDSIVGATYHNGSRLIISSDDKLFFSLGDVGQTERTQDVSFFGGKILRMNLDGSIPTDNPIPNNLVWAMGLRNSQGLAFGKNEKLYGSDHGPLNDDEVNLLIPNGNYGWPDVHGFIDTDNEKEYALLHPIIEPIQAWTPTLATAGLAYYGKSEIPEWKNSLIIATMKGRSIRVIHLSEDGNSMESESIFLQKEFGRFRDVAVSPEGEIFISTSNRDWHPRFQPWMYEGLPEGPDRILKIRVLAEGENKIQGLPIYRQETEPIPLMDENWNPAVSQEFELGSKLYGTHCLACHGPEGKGSEGLIPPLAKTDWVTGDKGKLIRIMLTGLSGEIEVNGEKYNQEMPPYNNLTDSELAEILTFIRNNFGNKSNAVIPGEIFEERKGL
ncbi:PQQ-dependent sugar dehydrogenase [Aquiflexum sp. TKW24L]|uniref:PQQ-dependent sugar dehydrogenase n=1 Tax=Aquiflexum sp. TKW24L TaxID=2942212 RepID=UPI0020BE8E2C|nr:PQQ-dependent sugar dehydrogenase [Aquiflexum sp. TKW24L]MCL6259452.1 PQQ-dependent sugar dehydrogenase [Aquiflexum sp. TKW24L]